MNLRFLGRLKISLTKKAKVTKFVDPYSLMDVS